MEQISVFDIFKIGVGPSSSHTIGPWRAATDFVTRHAPAISGRTRIRALLYGSLAKTGVGHGTRMAVIMGLTGACVETCDCSEIPRLIAGAHAAHRLTLPGGLEIIFDPDRDIEFRFSESLPYHSNAMRLVLEEPLLADAQAETSILAEETYYSIGGGFILRETEHGPIAPTLPGAATPSSPAAQTTPAAGGEFDIPHPVATAEDLRHWCSTLGVNIADVAWRNELARASEVQVRAKLDRILDVMFDSIYEGCHTDGILPGGLNVKRRAAKLNHDLVGDAIYEDRHGWMELVKRSERDLETLTDWITCFALAVNEVNAASGRIVTAPTNGAAGVIPAVLTYFMCLTGQEKTPTDLRRFLLVAAEIGSVFKRGATISAAAGGCQAEIGVSSAMAAAALTECRGGTFDQALIAAEVAMEHHLGLTCDPIRGLVQIPCIERNCMGAMKAITASQIALKRKPEDTRVSLDEVVKTMLETAQNMSTRYKETAEGGLAISVSLANC